MLRIRLLAGLLAGLLIALCLSVSAQDKLLTLDDLYGANRVNLGGGPPQGAQWLDAQNYLQRKFDPTTRSLQVLKVNALTGAGASLYETAKAAAAFAKLPGLTAQDAQQLAQAVASRRNGANTAGIANFANDLFYYEFGSDTATRLTNTAEEEVGEDFSPDGRMVSFVRSFNLYVADVARNKEWQLTSDGTARLFNGRLDWVYQEELYGRGSFGAYWWSPDSTKIVYLQLDESPVKDFTVVDHIPNQQNLETYDYPKSGMPNPTVRLGVLNAAGGATTWVDTFKYQPSEPLIPRVGWKPDSSRVVFHISNREQTWMDVNLADPKSGAVQTLFREQTKAWVEADNLNPPRWLKDGTFLFLSERTGWKHIYHYAADGKLLHTVTSGKWEARTLHGEADGTVYFSGTERSHIGSDVYKIKLDGTGLIRLSEQAGSHAASFDPTFKHYVDSWSDAWTPTQVRLHAADGKVVRVIDENKVAALSQYKLSKPELLTVKTRDGFEMEAMILKPTDFDARKKYPVFIHTYGGPHAPQVRNAFGSGMGNGWHQLLAQKGYIVWICDNRSASGKGAESAWAAYRNLGETELRDIEDGITYLKSQPYVDGARIGINGWSYGGYMTAYALTHSTSFKIGVCGAPVTDWHLYDTIYTERYMATPQNNGEGYEKSSVSKAAKNLSGKLLLIHGTIDDNVHMQNSIQFIYELQKAGKQFELMLYPKSRHGVADPRQVRHMREKMLDFILANL